MVEVGVESAHTRRALLLLSNKCVTRIETRKARVFLAVIHKVFIQPVEDG